ncbi:MAG: hypothetical protein ACRD2A_07195 [Vicinamibacterales bacterium]
MVRRTLATLLTVGVVACGGSPAVASVVHRFDAGEAALYVNAYLIETPHGVIAVDATLLAVLLTHGHPDHYNGVTNL